MPASRWMNEERTGFTEEILAVLARDPEVDVKGKTFGQRRRRIVDVPLIARPLSKDVHSFDFRKRILARLGVPEEQYQNKILLVSFGGQTIPKPVTSSSLTNGHRSIGLLPEGWIAIVCGLGVSSNASLRNDLPANFYAANVNVLLQEGDEEVEIYVPDLTAMADVVLGKLVRVVLSTLPFVHRFISPFRSSFSSLFLEFVNGFVRNVTTDIVIDIQGFGTCSETITASTPLVYGEWKKYSGRCELCAS